MLVALGENDIKTLDDFAGCSTDELFGWVEKTELGSKKQNGLLTGFDITMEKVEEMILMQDKNLVGLPMQMKLISVMRTPPQMRLKIIK